MLLIYFDLGPRFVLQPIRIFKGSFCGETLWENPFYVTPAKVFSKLIFEYNMSLKHDQMFLDKTFVEGEGERQVYQQ